MRMVAATLRPIASRKVDPAGRPLPAPLVASDRGAAGPCDAVVTLKHPEISEHDPDPRNPVPHTVIATRDEAAERCRNLAYCPRGAKRRRDPECCRVLAALESNDREAVTWALDRVYARARRAATWLPDGEDMAQEAVFTIYRDAPGWDGPANHLFQEKIRNARRRHLRARRRSRTAYDTPFIENGVADPFADRAERIDGSIQRFDRCLAIEAERYGKREHLSLARGRLSLTSAQIAQAWNMNENTVRARESRARSFLIPACVRAMGQSEYRGDVIRAVQATRLKLEQCFDQAKYESFFS